MKNSRIQKWLTTRYTFMLVPHGSKGPVQINIPLSVIILIIIAWTGITMWGSYLSAQHVDYWRAELSNKVLNLKVQYLTTQLEKSRGFLDEVKQIEAKLRELLQYKSKTDILFQEDEQSFSGTGGPSLNDQADITRMVSGMPPDLTWSRLVDDVKSFKSEIDTRLASFENLSKWIDYQRDLFKFTPRGWPCPGHLSSHFGRRIDPFSKEPEYHYGIDISGPHGTPIRSTADGKVKIAKWHSGYGNLVVIEHNYGYTTRYAHNGRLLVKVGDRIDRGQAIALMGNTGKSSGPHCHYEVWRNKRRVNPYAFLIGNFPNLVNENKVTAKSSNREPNS